jgi:hypothetical protein
MVGYISLILLFGPSCSDSTAPEIISQPVLVPNASGSVPLTAYVEFTTNIPTSARIELKGSGTSRELIFDDVSNQTHRLPVIGLKAGRAYELSVHAADADGNSIAFGHPLPLRTSKLPADFPPLQVTISQPDRMEPGWTLFGAQTMTSNDSEETHNVTMAVDSSGEVVWYYDGEPSMEAPLPLRNGQFLALHDHAHAFEFTLMGDVYRRWHAAGYPNNGEPRELSPNSIAVDTQTFHHDIAEMPSGNFLVLSTEMLDVDDFPADLSMSGSTVESVKLISDVVVEFDPDGSVVHEWNLRGMLDPNRNGYDSGGNVWARWGFSHIEGGTKDWTHGNSVFYSSSDDSILVSLRHQDAVISFSRETGQLSWILGNHNGWGQQWQKYLLQPEGELEWQYHQHAARVADDGRVILFDNGNHRAWPPAEKMPIEDHYSRVVEYQVDPDTMTVQQVWSFGGPGSEHFFSSFVSEADWLPSTGNILVTDGGRTRDEEGQMAAGERTKRQSARVFEVTRDQPSQKVFELIIEDQSEKDPKRWMVYRSQRIPVPQGQ